MKALSLTQPWATLVAIGGKRFETRSWSTKYRGPLAIHAAKGFPAWAKECCEEEFYKPALDGLALPLGMVVATCRLVNVHHVEDVRCQLSKREIAFGNYDDGRFAWELSGVRMLAIPLPAKGSLGLWSWQPPATSDAPI